MHYLLRPKSAIKSYGPIPQGTSCLPVGDASDADASWLDRKPESQDAGRKYDNPFAEKGTFDHLNDDLDVPSLDKLSTLHDDDQLDIHEDPEFLPPRDDLRRRRVRTVQDKEDDYRKVSFLLSCLVTADQTN